MLGMFSLCEDFINRPFLIKLLGSMVEWSKATGVK